MSSTSQTRSINLDRVLDEQVDWRYKSFPPGPPTTIRAVRSRGWNVLGGEFMLPVMVLKDSALRHNSRVMASYCVRHDVMLAPHGKTAMSPPLLQMPFDDGATGVPAARMRQVRGWRALGYTRRVLDDAPIAPAPAAIRTAIRTA